MKSLKLSYLITMCGGLASSTGIVSGAIAMGLPSQQNIALGKPTFGDTAFGAPTSRGNDGIDGNESGGNWTHADFPTSAVPYPNEVTNAPNPYWEVDLGGTYNLDSANVTDRVGCCDPSRLDGSTVTFFGAGGSVVGTETITVLSGGGTYSWNNGGSGYAGVERIRIDGSNGGVPIRYFQFSELQALSLVQVPINWALGAAAQFYDSSGTPVDAWGGLPAFNITDGNLNTLSHPLNQQNAGYYVDIDLGQEILVDSLDLTGRLDGCCPNRLQDFTIEFVDGLGAVTHSMPISGQVTTTTNIDVIGSYGGEGPLAQNIRIVNSSGDDYGPQIGELEVYGIAAIPEPSGALLSLLGTTLLFRRRR
ncbi:discoidin domain-containing protein [bacterium]|nr:discoidin domain-containing protein [bacterium]